MRAQDLRSSSNLGIRGLFIVAKTEMVAFFRNKGLILSQLIQPILYVIFIIVGLSQSLRTVHYQGITMSYAQYATVGISSILIIGQMSQVIYRVTIDKRYGLLALKLSSGIKPIYYILGMNVYPVLGLIVQEIVLFTLSVLFGINFTFVQSLIILALSVISLLFWDAIGIIITVFINNYETRDLVIRFLLTPLGFTAPTFYVLSEAPKFVQLFGYLNPLTYQITIIRDASLGLSNFFVISSLPIVAILVILIVSTIIPRINLVIYER